jgi:crotonobetaine/carnitine-CoA ligase
MVLRTARPWELSSGYLGDPDGTAAAWRNGWFHTGDLFTVDEDGFYRFCDRTKDALRRRGENVSSFEVEREVSAHPAVAEAACVGVRDANGVDDEVKVYVVPVGGTTIDFDDLLRFCADRMPHFMVPRYFENVDALPKTATMRVRKHLLREAGPSEATWDREVAGWKVTRDGLARR